MNENTNKQDIFSYPAYNHLKTELYYWKKILSFILISIGLLSFILNFITWHIYSTLWSIPISLGAVYIYRVLIWILFDQSYKRIGKFLWINFSYLVALITISSFLFKSFNLVMNILFPIMIVSMIIFISFLSVGDKTTIYKDFWYLIFTFLGNSCYFFIFFYLTFKITVPTIIFSLTFILITVLAIFLIKLKTIQVYLSSSFYK
ncbi:hypothetical protein H9L18_12595 [Vagococcus carniphilus]|uniref:Uncharacterized protein n=1 Tax=Vagococcus carniphilus TaxID=218144 RepID=A0A430B652_9ENTE|nr:hypothetical protein [Vagococcus carniphilus]QNN72684.1 hypothetical protein H9L18_12595 [Vagococcus carniphilus]RSU15790.1 hypothetical protein CBF28_04970 [Vagococcus carniphilus]